MFERFTEPARQVIVLAQDEARALKHNYIGTEHLLLGLLREGDGNAARVLESLGVTVEQVRADVARIVGEGDEVAAGQVPFTPRTKKILELALREALSLGHDYIGTEHLLLGLVRENEGVAARILLDFGADAETIRNGIIRMLSGPGRRQQEHDEPAAAWRPEASIFAPELLERLEQLRRDKEAAIDASRFEEAAALRDGERRLVLAAAALERVWLGIAAQGAPSYSVSQTVTPRRVSTAEVLSRDPLVRLAIVVAAIVVAAGFPLGLLVGWVIWA